MYQEKWGMSKICASSRHTLGNDDDVMFMGLKHKSETGNSIVNSDILVIQQLTRITENNMLTKLGPEHRKTKTQ